MPSALQGRKLSDWSKARPTYLSHTNIDRLVHSCRRWMAVSSDPNDTSSYTSQRNINESSQETVNETNHRTVSKTSHETSVKLGMKPAQKIKELEQISKDRISETIMETCYNTDPESLKIVETSCMRTKMFNTDKYRDVFENADTDNAHKSDTSIFSNQFIHYTATPLSNEADVRSSLQLQAVPSHCITFVRGSFNLADCMFSQETRRSQCTVNGLYALTFAKFSDLQTKQNLDQVLLHGDKLYNISLFGFKAKGVFKSKLLTFEELPNMVAVFDKEISVDKHDIISGVCTQQFDTLGLPSLHQALHTAFQRSSHILIDLVCSAIFEINEEYYY